MSKKSGMFRRSLQTAFPEIAKEWDTERNGLQASEIGLSSRRKFWWRCPVGHSYQNTVCTRIRTKGCKICSAPGHGERVRLTKLSRSRTLAESSPDLVADWHPSKNGDLTPQTVSYASKLKIWWQCSIGHEWQATPSARQRGTGCPKCYEQRRGEIIRASRLKQSGCSFAQAYPLLLAEWDFERNTLDPTRLPPKSGVRASWVCKLGHRWETTVTNRTHNGSNCPECVPQSSRLEMALLAELRSIYPEVLWRRKVDGAECDLLLPAKSLGIEVDGGYWHANKAERDEAKTAHLASHGITLIRARDNTLPAVPRLVVSYASKDDEFATVLAVLRKMAEVAPDEAVVAYVAAGRRQNEAGYRDLVARLPAPPVGETLADTNPDIAAQWDYKANSPLKPEFFSKGSDQKFWWICSAGHRWSATIKNRTLRGSGCPVCARETQSVRTTAWRLSKAGSLAETDPELLAWWDYKKNEMAPDTISARSGTPVWWQCTKRHSFKRAINVHADKRSCPECFGIARAPLSLVLPRLPFKPVGVDDTGLVSTQSSELIEWECPRGHHFRLPPRIAVTRSRCPVCAGYENPSELRPVGLSFAESRPHLVTDWIDNDHSPHTTSASSGIKVLWRCGDCGNEWRSTPKARASGRGCPKCGNGKAAEATRLRKLAKTGSLASVYPELVREFDAVKNEGLRPEDLSPGSHRKVWWRCALGHEWLTSPNQRILRGKICNCPKCANAKRVARLREVNRIRLQDRAQ